MTMKWASTEAKLLECIQNLINSMPQDKPDDKLAGFLGCVAAAGNLGPERTVEAFRRYCQAVEQCPVTVTFQKTPTRYVIYTANGVTEVDALPDEYVGYHGGPRHKPH